MVASWHRCHLASRWTESVRENAGPTIKIRKSRVLVNSYSYSYQGWYEYMGGIEMLLESLRQGTRPYGVKTRRTPGTSIRDAHTGRREGSIGPDNLQDPIPHQPRKHPIKAT